MNLQGIGMTSARTRDRLIQRLREKGIEDTRVLEAMRMIPRHVFVEEALASRAYEDTALPIGLGQTISQPYIVARMTEALLENGPLDTVLEVGTGSGYQAAILSVLVRRVYSVERIKALSDRARRCYQQLKLRNIQLRYSDGGMGLQDYAPYDAIIATAAPEAVPVALVEQLKVGGCLVMPVGDRGGQTLVRVRRTEDALETEALEKVSFVPMLGGTS